MLFSLLIFSNENNIAKVIGDMWGNCFNKMSQSLNSWMRMNMIFKSSCSQMFYKIGVLKKFAKFSWKHLRPATMLKKRLQRRCFTVNFAKFLRTRFLQNTSGRLLLFFLIRFTVFLPTQWSYRDQVFSIFLTCLKAYNFIEKRFISLGKLFRNLFHGILVNGSF